MCQYDRSERQAGGVPHARWTWDRAVAIAAGGAVGASCRWFVVEASGSHRFPWPVLLVNLVGSLVLGVLLAEEPEHPRAHVALHDFGAIGFCGALTTFSTFAVEIVELIDRGDGAYAVLYGIASVAGAIVAVLTGAALMRRVRAIELPLEEAP
jgi:fluoride exporter